MTTLLMKTPKVQVITANSPRGAIIRMIQVTAALAIAVMIVRSRTIFLRKDGDMIFKASELLDYVTRLKMAIQLTSYSGFDGTSAYFLDTSLMKGS